MIYSANLEYLSHQLCVMRFVRKFIVREQVNRSFST